MQHSRRRQTAWKVCHFVKHVSHSLPVLLLDSSLYRCPCERRSFSYIHNKLESVAINDALPLKAALRDVIA